MLRNGAAFLFVAACLVAVTAVSAYDTASQPSLRPSARSAHRFRQRMTRTAAGRALAFAMSDVAAVAEGNAEASAVVSTSGSLAGESVTEADAELGVGVGVFVITVTCANWNGYTIAIELPARKSEEQILRESFKALKNAVAGAHVPSAWYRLEVTSRVTPSPTEGTATVVATVQVGLQPVSVEQLDHVGGHWADITQAFLPLQKENLAPTIANCLVVYTTISPLVMPAKSKADDVVFVTTGFQYQATALTLSLELAPAANKAKPSAALIITKSSVVGGGIYGSIVHKEDVNLPFTLYFGMADTLKWREQVFAKALANGRGLTELRDEAADPRDSTLHMTTYSLWKYGCAFYQYQPKLLLLPLPMISATPEALTDDGIIELLHSKQLVLLDSVVQHLQVIHHLKDMKLSLLIELFAQKLAPKALQFIAAVVAVEGFHDFTIGDICSFAGQPKLEVPVGKQLNCENTKQYLEFFHAFRSAVLVGWPDDTEHGVAAKRATQWIGTAFASQRNVRALDIPPEHLMEFMSKYTWGGPFDKKK